MVTPMDLGHSLSAAVRAAVEGPAWFTLAGLVAGALAAVSLHRRPAGRRPVGLLHLAVGLVAAAAALPDTELVVTAALAVLATAAVAWRLPGPWVGHPALPALVGAATTLAVWDGARGRPGTAMLVPVVVAPVLADGRWASRSALLTGLRLAVGLGAGVIAARHTALDEAVLRPAVGATAAALAVAVVYRLTATARGG